MKKVKGFGKKISSSFTVGMNQRPLVMTILLLVLINFVFLLITASVAMFISPDEFDNYIGALVAVTSYLIVPATVAGVENIPLMVLGMVVIVVGMLLFTGTIIALATNVLRTYLSNRDKAQGHLNVAGHIVILRYNEEVPAILVDLMRMCSSQAVLILSDKTKAEVMSDLMACIATMKKKPKGRIKLIVRQGDPTSLNEMEEISLASARGLLIMNDKRSKDEKLCEADFSRVLKLVINLAHFNLPTNFPIGVETSTQEAADIMTKLQNTLDGLQGRSIRFFSHNKKLGQFLALAVVCPELYNMLRQWLDVKGFGQRPEQSEKAICDRILDLVQNARVKQPRKLYVIGENKKLSYFLDTLRLYPNIKVKHCKTDDIGGYVNDLVKYGDENTIAVILSDDTVKPDGYDANVFLTLIKLSHVLGIDERKFKIIAEILDPTNKKRLEKFNVQDVVVSTEIISQFASKLLCDIRAEQFYEKIFSFSCASICDSAPVTPTTKQTNRSTV